MTQEIRSTQETASDWETVRADAVTLMSRYVQFDTTNPPGQGVKMVYDVIREFCVAGQ